MDLNSLQDCCVVLPTTGAMWFRCMKHKGGSAFYSKRVAHRPHCFSCRRSGFGEQQFCGCLTANPVFLQESCKGIVCFLEMKSTVITEAGYCAALHVRLTFPNVHPSSPGSVGAASTHQQHAVRGTKWLVSSKSQLTGACCLHMSSQSLSPLTAATAVA